MMATRYQIEERGRRSQFLTDSFQRGLAHWNRERLAPRLPDDDWNALLDRDTRMLRLERGFLQELRDEVREKAAAATRRRSGTAGEPSRLRRS